MKNVIIFKCLIFLFLNDAGSQVSLDRAAFYSRTDYLHNKKLSGKGMVIHIYETGKPLLSHEQFTDNRITIGRYIDDAVVKRHATYIGAFILAAGVGNKGRGMAFDAKGIFNYAGYDLEDAVKETPGLLISNHSYTKDDALYLSDPAYFGLYNEDSRIFDFAMFYKPYWLLVGATNNVSAKLVNISPMEKGYDMLPTRFGTSKNSLIVTNAEVVSLTGAGKLYQAKLDEDVAVGPTDDLRIKPDITGFGTNVISASNESPVSYVAEAGASSACANVSGTLLLLQENFYNQNQRYMLAATLKGLALHTADFMNTTPDSPGPDVRSGWGLINAKFAGETIDKRNSTAIIEEKTLQQGEVFSMKVKASGLHPLKASICWTDPPGKVPANRLNSSVPILVNDLDLRITGRQLEFKPYALQSAGVTILDDNFRDPFERVDMLLPRKGEEFTIVVTHKGSLEGGKQNFSLIITGIGDAQECLETITLSNPIKLSQVIEARNINNSTEITGPGIDVQMLGGLQVLLGDGTAIHTIGNFYSSSDGNCGDGGAPGNQGPPQQRVSTNGRASGEGVILEKEPSVNKGFRLYPNPATDMLTLMDVAGIRHCKIYNTQGKLVHTTSFAGQKYVRFSVGALTPGMYILIITHADGTVSSNKLLKE